MVVRNRRVFLRIGVILISMIIFFSSDGEKKLSATKIMVKDITGVGDAEYRVDEKGKEWSKLVKTMEIPQNTIIATGKDTEVILDLGDGKGEFTIKQLSMVKVVDFEIKPVGNTTSLESKVQVKIGKVNLKLKKTEQLQGKIKVDTPTETASITGTDCDFNVTPYGSSIVVNETAKRVEVMVPTAGLMLNIATKEQVQTTYSSSAGTPEVKIPIQIVKEVSERKDVQLNITQEEKKFQITVNVSLDNIKPIQHSTQESISKELIKNTVREHTDELPPTIISHIEQIIGSTINLPPTTITTSLPEDTITTTIGGGTITSGVTSCPNNTCF